MITRRPECKVREERDQQQRHQQRVQRCCQPGDKARVVAECSRDERSGEPER
jgi:hypothetical protein